jgi:hypothetical protein
MQKLFCEADCGGRLSLGNKAMLHEPREATVSTESSSLLPIKLGDSKG